MDGSVLQMEAVQGSESPREYITYVSYLRVVPRVQVIIDIRVRNRSSLRGTSIF